MIVEGEASETDEDEEFEADFINQSSADIENVTESDRDKKESTKLRSWSVHVDEKLEQRWRTLAVDTAFVSNRYAFSYRKQLEGLKRSIANIQGTMQEASFNIREAVESLGRLEVNVSLVIEGAKFVPSIMHFETEDGSNVSKQLS